jgi:hypothetical protein
MVCESKINYPNSSDLLVWSGHWGYITQNWTCSMHRRRFGHDELLVIWEQPDKMIKAGKYILYDVMRLNIHWELIPCAISSYGKCHPQKWLYFVGKATTKRRKKSRGRGRRDEYVQKLSTFHCCLVSRFERNL